MSPLDQKSSTSGVNQRPVGVPERRQEPRHRLRDAPGVLGWREEDQLFTCEMTLVDISGGGAAMLAERAPTVHHPAWIRLESGAAGSEQLEARVVSVSAEPFGKYMVRLQFASWLPLGNVLERHEEHRLWQRYPARETRASLLWIDQDIERKSPGELVNISGGGAAVITDALLPVEQPVWLTLMAGTVALTPVEARLVAVSIDASGLRIARFRFVEPCPMDLFELAVHGEGD